MHIDSYLWFKVLLTISKQRNPELFTGTICRQGCFNYSGKKEFRTSEKPGGHLTLLISKRRNGSLGEIRKIEHVNNLVYGFGG